MRLIKTKKNFRKEFKRQLRYAMAAACGFLIIFSWKEAIWSSTTKLLERLQESTRFVTSEVLSAIILSIIAVAIIIISAKLLKE
jgi:hypothetical protein